MTLSIIVPVYNSEEYLPRCIDSLLAQGEKSFEIILVDDGSTDKSQQLCDEYAKYSNIKALHISNAGPATAKNKGLEIAEGEYVSFIDSDDAIESDMYTKMIESATRHNADVVCCSYRQVDEQGNKSEQPTTGKEYVFTQEEAVAHILMKDKIFSQNWTKIFRRNMLQDNSVSFIDGLKTDEDILFNLDAMVYCKIVTVVDEPLYVYTYRQQSLARFYVMTNFMQFNENLLMRLDKTQKMVEKYWPNIQQECTIHCLMYYNLLIGKSILFSFDEAKPYFLKAIEYIRKNALTLYRNRQFCGFSKIGTILALLLPPRMYFLYRKNKLNNA